MGTTLEESCAAANDCWRMAEYMEGFLVDIDERFPILRRYGLWKTIEREGQATANQFLQDSVSFAERSQQFLMREILHQTTIGSDLFSLAWETDWTDNQVVRRLIGMIDEFLSDIQVYLANEFLYRKALITTSKAVTNLYVRCLVSKADAVTRRRRRREWLPGDTQPFQSHHRALRRISDDISLLRQYFMRQTENTMKRIVLDDMYILELVRECLGAEDVDSVEAFIVVVHKHTGADLLVTRFFVGDLWMLMNEEKPRRSHVRHAIQTLQPDLQMVTTGMKEIGQREEKKDDLSFISLDDMLRVLYEDRVAQGVLPACWSCLPKVEAIDEMIAIKPIRSITRKVAELTRKKKLGKC